MIFHSPLIPDFFESFKWSTQPILYHYRKERRRPMSQKQSGLKKAQISNLQWICKCNYQSKKIKCCVKDLFFQPILLFLCYIKMHCQLILIKFKILDAIQWRPSCSRLTIKTHAKHPLVLFCSISLPL